MARGRKRRLTRGIWIPATTSTSPARLARTLRRSRRRWSAGGDVDVTAVDLRRWRWSDKAGAQVTPGRTADEFGDGIGCGTGEFDQEVALGSHFGPVKIKCFDH